MHVGDSVMCEGPIGRLRYHGHGNFKLLKNELKPKTKVGLIAGGSGITPLLAIAQASILAEDGLEVTLLFSNKTKGDILCLDQIAELAEKNATKFRVFHTLTRHSDGDWDGLTGHVTMEMLRQCGFPEPADDVLIASCGPPAMKTLVSDFLKENGYEQDEMFV